MDSWRAHGLLAFTINMQGGSPLGYGNKGWINSAYDPKGELRPAYMARLKRIMDKANEIGMVPILGLFYNDQEDLLEDETAVLNAVDNVIDWLFAHDYRHVIIEINNECNLKYRHEILQPKRVHEVIEHIQAKQQNGHRYLVSTSYSGRQIPRENVVAVADFLLVHGNGVKDPARIPEMVRKTKGIRGYTPKPFRLCVARRPTAPNTRDPPLPCAGSATRRRRRAARSARFWARPRGGACRRKFADVSPRPLWPKAQSITSVS